MHKTKKINKIKVYNKGYNWEGNMKKDNFNIMGDIKIIEEIKAQIICILGELFTLLTRGSNVAKDAIVNCIASLIILLYFKISCKSFLNFLLVLVFSVWDGSFRKKCQLERLYLTKNRVK